MNFTFDKHDKLEQSKSRVAPMVEWTPIWMPFHEYCITLKCSLVSSSVSIHMACFLSPYSHMQVRATSLFG